MLMNKLGLIQLGENSWQEKQQRKIQNNVQMFNNLKWRQMGLNIWMIKQNKTKHRLMFPNIQSEHLKQQKLTGNRFFSWLDIRVKPLLKWEKNKINK